MARRRKSNANGKTKSKDRSVSTESDTQHEGNEEKNLIGSNKVIDSASEPTQSDNSESINDIDNSQERMMPLDIQQMILGDLQSAGRGEEIIVSRESGADIMEDGAEEVVAELGAVVESPREEEYDIHSEGEEEEELVFMNEEDGEEGQYVIVVNSEFDVTDDTSQEVMSIQNLSELQEGSCEIITVVRESDYDSSQESLDGMEEEECDNINAVIGTIDGIHCVKISQYHSDDESSNHDSSFEKEEIRVTEHETEIECFTAFDNGSDQNMVGCLMANEDDNIESCELSSDAKDDILNTDENHEMFDCRETPSSEMVREDENSQVRTNKKLPQGQTGAEIVDPTMKNDHSKGLDSFENDDEMKHSLNLKNEKTDLNVVEMLPFLEVNMKPTANDSDSDLKQPISQNKSIDVKSTRNNLADSSECEASVKKSEKSTIVSENSYSSTLDSHFTCAGIEPLATTVKSESHSGSLQEHNITSNSSVSESVPSVGTPKMETLSNSPLDYVCVQASNVKIEDKTDSLSKEETLKFEEDKQSAFRSRSGSTDTTGSESGSNSSSGRRRSGRIRSIGASKLSEIDIKQGGGATAVVTSTTTPPVPGYELDKPVKVKSRWRRSSELEMGSSNKRQQELDVITANARLIESDTSNTSTPPSRAGRPSTPPDTPPSDKEVEEILLNFQHLDCNEYLTDRSRSKDAKRMVCDCMLTKEEIARGDMGCGEDCLNRLLMIECGARCMLGERCANKRFQNLEYSKCEVFKTEMKGFGLRALDDIPTDTFLLEYVGEVLDPKEFRRRAKEYAKDKNLHFYFMALKSDSIIDATQKGNISRFINHSCDPNAETQKWTVNGELRVGFFSKRPISAGEEITFDYKFQRYGKEAQRCYCQTASCRGWIGEDPEKENKWSDVSGRNKERREKERKKKEDKRNVKDILNDIDLEEEIEKLVLKNRAQTLMLCRLMVRAEDHSSRVQLLRILQKGETACLRLFLDYHGLRLVWSWMMDPASSSSLKIEILETLSKLPIPNKTMLQDSKVLSVVEKWSTAALPVTEAKDRSSTEDDSDKTESDKDKQVKGSDTEKNSDDSNSSKPVETEEQHETNKQKIIEVSNILLKDWASLKEVFRIPKKERIEQMKEHEREADKVSRDSSVEKQDKSYDRHRSQDKYRNDFDRRDRDRDKERDRDRDKDRKRGRDSPDSDRSRKSSRMDDRQAQITKMERRQLFAIKAAQEDEERQRRQQEQVWQEQVHLAAQELAAQQAQQEANNFAGFPGFPPPQQWMPFPPDPNMMPPPQHMEAQQMFGGMNPNNQPPPFLFNQPGPHMHQHPPFLDPSHNPPFHNPVNPIFNHPPPLPKQPLLPTPNQPSLLTPPLPNQPLIQTPNQPLLPTPPLPNQPYLPQQQNEPLLPIQPMSNKPLPINVPSFTTQPPLPSQPPPIVITNQPTPVPTLSFSQDVIPPQLFQSALPPQNQFSQPPPFVSQPPLPSVPPTQNHQPVFQSPIPAQFQPPLPQTSVVPVTSTVSSVPLYVPTPVRLPPKWKSAKDAEGRTYYYHVKTRVSQWEPPLWEQHQQTVQESDTDSESSESDEDESSSEEEEQEEEKMVEEEETQPTEEVNHDDYLGCEELGDSPYEPETMELLEDIVEDTKKKRKDVLVQERIISPRTADEIPDKLDKRKIRELKERLRRQKAKEKLRLKQKSKSKGRSGTSKCEADTSSDPGRKIKDAFRLNMAGVIVHYLNVYRKPDCKFGKITNTEDFKHLARKLTHFVMLKELKHCRSVDELECNDNVKHKARDFIKKYMSKFGAVYQRPSDDD